jgi:hypothetical protein
MRPDDFGEIENPYAAPLSSSAHEPPADRATEGLDPSVHNPFFTIWTRPRATIRGIVDTDPTLHVTGLAVLAGIVRSLDNAARRNAGNNLPLAALMVASLIGGTIGGLLGLYLGGWLFRHAGKWFGGRADSEEVRAAIAWSAVPVVTTLPIGLFQVFFFGKDLFTKDGPKISFSDSSGIVLLATGLIQLILSVWTIVLFLRCLGEVHRFSAWKALLSLFALTGALMAVIVVAVAVWIAVQSR